MLLDLHRIIVERGWAVRLLGAGHALEDVEFAYTVGLTTFALPEVVVTGLPTDVAHVFLHEVGDRVRAGERFAHGTVSTHLAEDDAPVVCLRAEVTARLTAVHEVHGRVEVLQLVWPDSTGHLPSQEGYRNPPHVQPLLGPRPG